MAELNGIVSGASSHLHAADFDAGLWKKRTRDVYNRAAAADSKDGPEAGSQEAKSNLLDQPRAFHRGRIPEYCARGDTFLGDRIGHGTGPQAILTDIEELLLDLLHCLSQGALPDFQVPTIRKGAKRALPLEGTEVFERALADAANVIVSQVSFTAKQAAGTYRYTRILKMLTIVHELVRTGRSAPQRDIYYQVKGPPLFTAPRHVADAIEEGLSRQKCAAEVKHSQKDVSMLLEVPRSSLGICTSTKGLVAGKLEIQQSSSAGWTDCRSAARSIPGDCGAIQGFSFRSTARCISRYIVVVEKDAVFQRLVEEDFCASTDSILVTARGMPDLPTRAFLDRLASALPRLVIAAVVDWNPSGVGILRTYKHGGGRSLQGYDLSLPSLRWLALHARQVDGLPEDGFQSLNDNDRRTIRSLRSSPIRVLPAWMHELDVMEANGVKAEIEAAYQQCGYGAFARDLAARLGQGLYF